MDVPVAYRPDRRPAYENRLHLPYGKPATVSTDLGTWAIDTSELPRYSAKDMGLAPEER